MSTSDPEHNRPLHVDFDLHTDGDLRFKREFIMLLIANLHELHHAWRSAIENNEESVFKLIAHKVKPTLTILNDPELSTLVEELTLKMSNIQTNLQFNKLCTSIIQSLEIEMNK